jgi:hypothetical protein
VGGETAQAEAVPDDEDRGESHGGRADQGVEEAERCQHHCHGQLGSPQPHCAGRRLQDYLAWRNANARHPDALAAQRRERARIRNERQ